MKARTMDEPIALTPMELRVLRLSMLSIPQMIRVLGGGTLSGLRFHVRNIMNKLGASTRGEAVVVALRLGIVSLDELMLSSDRAIPRPDTWPALARERRREVHA
jgi:DNA-binding CsgD family transcriptional regulator